MKFPDNILSSGERVERDLRPHWLVILPPILLSILIIAVVAVIAWLTPDESTWNIVEWVVIGIGVLLLIPVLLIPLLRWRTTHYVVTNRRVVVRRGILAKQGKDIALSRITDVSFRQSLLDRIIKSGTLTVESAGDGHDEEFNNIPRSNEVQQLINRLVEEDIDGRGFHGAGGRQARYEAGGYGRDAQQPPEGYSQHYDDQRAVPPAGQQDRWETPER